MGRVERLLHSLDGFQQRHRVPAVLWAVQKKYSDDRGGHLAALIAYYGFLSLFPCLLVLLTIFSYLLASHPALKDRLPNGPMGRGNHETKDGEPDQQEEEQRQEPVVGD